MTTEDSMSDDVFEDPETSELKSRSNVSHGVDTSSHFYHTEELNVKNPDDENYFRTPSPSGYPGYKPPREALRMYALQSEYFIENKIYDDLEDETDAGGRLDGDRRDDDGGWNDYKKKNYSQEKFDDTISHKTILLGDSGVGKTSFLVKFNTGEFRAGSFSATVGIALTKKKLPKTKPTKSTNGKKISFKKFKVPKHRGVVMLRRIPHGFFEEQMRQYFSQFGAVTRVRVARSRKTGRSKGYAFVEFAMPEVAQVAAETMDNYMMFNKTMKTTYIPPKEQKFNYFASSVHAITVDGQTKYTSKELERRLNFKNSYNSKTSEIQYKRRMHKIDSHMKKLQNKYGPLGIEIDPVVMNQKIKQMLCGTKKAEGEGSPTEIKINESVEAGDKESSSESEAGLEENVEINDFSDDGDDEDVEMNVSTDEDEVNGHGEDVSTSDGDDSEDDESVDEDVNDDDGSESDEDEDENQSSEEEEPTPPPSPPAKKKSKKQIDVGDFKNLLTKKNFGGIQKKKSAVHKQKPTEEKLIKKQLIQNYVKSNKNALLAAGKKIKKK